MRGALAFSLVLVLAPGCASLHHRLEADRDEDYDAEYTFDAPCWVRTDAGPLIGAHATFELAMREGARLVAHEDGATIWGSGRLASNVTYTFGQLCTAARACHDYLFLDDGKYRVWMQVETVRPAPDATTFEAQLQEGRLIDGASKLIANDKQHAVFARVAAELESAESTRTSLWLAVLPGVVGTIAEVSASVDAASATLDAQLLLGHVTQFLDQHNVRLYGGRGGELRVFEVVRTLCVTKNAAAIASD